jgi:hypothetical protein
MRPDMPKLAQAPFALQLLEHPIWSRSLPSSQEAHRLGVV